MPSRTVRTGRGLPEPEVDHALRVVRFGEQSRLDLRPPRPVPSPCDGTTTRASSAAGGASPRRLWTSGHTATSTPSMQPDATSRMSQEPSEPSSSTDPDMPLRPFAPRSRAVRMSVSASQRYSTAGNGGGWLELHGNGHDLPLSVRRTVEAVAATTTCIVVRPRAGASEPAGAI